MDKFSKKFWDIETTLYRTEKNDQIRFYKELILIGKVVLRNKKIIHFNKDGTPTFKHFQSSTFFTYSFTPEFKDSFNEKVNTRIHVDGLDMYYHFVRLNLLQRIKLSWAFKQTFIQKHENIKWIIGMIITFITGYIIAKVRCNC